MNRPQRHSLTMKKSTGLLLCLILIFSAISVNIAADHDNSIINTKTTTTYVDFDELIHPHSDGKNQASTNDLIQQRDETEHSQDPFMSSNDTTTNKDNDETQDIFLQTSSHTQTSRRRHRELQTGNVVVGIQVVNTKTNSIIIDNLVNGQIIALGSYGLTTEDDLNFIIKVGTGALSVVMDTAFKKNFSIESSLPFTLCGDLNGTYLRCKKQTSIRLGANSITATPYSQTLGTGLKGTAYTRSFSISTSSTPIAPAPIAPIPTAPIPTAPIPTAPIPTAPIPTAPIPTAPIPTAPIPTAPIPTAPVPIAPVPAPTVTGNVVVKLQLVSEITDQVVIDNVQNNANITAGSVQVSDISELTFVAITGSGTQSVVFDLNGVVNYRIESTTPFSLCGDLNGQLFGCSSLVVGMNTIKVTPYSLIGGTGTAGTPLSIAVQLSNVGATGGAHLAHSVAGGPYTGIALNSSNVANVKLDGETSHTHGIGLNLNSIVWKEGSKVLGNTEIVTVPFTAGLHTISLTVKDSGNNVDTEVTIVDVKSFGFPAITSLTPDTGTLTGGNSVTIKGSGFNHPVANVTVMFGQVKATGLVIQDASTIVVTAPASALAIPVAVTVITPLGTSNTFEYLYTSSSGSIPVSWQDTVFLSEVEPTSGRFGPDEKLYVGTRRGVLLKITMNNDFTTSTNVISKNMVPNQAITGLTFDPMDPTPTNPSVYFTANPFFHKGELSSSGTSVGGRIMKASGPTLDTLITVISGLPVSDLDHGLNGMEFGDKGELYFTSGSNTNGGIPGPLSSSQKLKENFLSAAVSVAYLSSPGFNGTIKWSAPDDGNMIASGIDLFAMGMRNPYSVLLHSNGNLYATENGPNTGYGRMSTDCNGGSITDAKGPDEFLLLQKGAYMGHSNPKRASYFNDPRQCIYVNSTESGPAGYTKPLVTFPSSRNGMVEFRSNHFGGQLRGHVIIAHFAKVPSLGRLILNEAGTDVVPESKNILAMNVGSKTLDVCMAPNGNIIEMRYGENALAVLKPVEPVTTTMVVHTCFPGRGLNGGGNTLSIYGVNFKSSDTVSIGGRNCPVINITSTKITCTLPGGSGTVDIIVSRNGFSSTFSKGYRYISGVQSIGFVLPVYN